MATAARKPEAPDTLRIWNAVCRTDPRHTKRVNQRGGFTAIDAQYQIMEATKQFGPVGVGWGYTVGDYRIEGGMIVVPVTLWHGERGNTFGPILGCAEMLGQRPDRDAPKKAITDAITKGLSQLGFNADVFLGLYDDNKYVAELKKEFEAANEGGSNDDDDGYTGPKGKKTELRQAINGILNAVRKAASNDAINDILKKHKDTLERAEREWPALIEGDPKLEGSGLKPFVQNRRAELAGAPQESLGLQMLRSALKECASRADLNNLLDQHGSVADALEGEESRKWEAAFNAQERAIIAMANVGAG